MSLVVALHSEAIMTFGSLQLVLGARLLLSCECLLRAWFGIMASGGLAVFGGLAPVWENALSFIG